MARAGVAVMAHYAVGDEIPRLGGDVVEAHGLQRLDAEHDQACVALHGLALDVELARNGRGDGMEEAQVLAQSALQSHDVDGFAVVMVDVLNHGAEIEVKQTPPNPGDDFGIGVGNAEDRLAEAPLSIKYPGEEASRPRSRR